MKFRRTKTFVKQYKKLPPRLQTQFGERLMLWIEHPTHPRLRVHPLKGAHAGYWSMNVSGDVRMLFYFERDEVVVLALIGTHSELYE